MVSLSPHGELSERFKELVLKTSDSERNLGFESLTLRQKFQHPKRMLEFLIELGFENINATVRWTVAADGWTEANIYLRHRRRCKRIPNSPPKRTHFCLPKVCSFFIQAAGLVLMIYSGKPLIISFEYDRINYKEMSLKDGG